MKNKLHYAPEALRDLDDIWEYIALELNNPAAAKRTVSRIMDSADGLAEFAEAGAPLRSVADVESDYRFLVCGNYLIRVILIRKHDRLCENAYSENRLTSIWKKCILNL